MSGGNDNPSSRCVLVLCIGAALLFFTAAHPSLAAAPAVPPVPVGPTAKGVPAPPPAPLAPAASNAPIDTAGEKRAASPADDKRMVDLAKRIATAPKSPESPAIPATPVHESNVRRGASDGPPNPADPAKADPVSAAKSNKQRLADPDDLKPLGARNRSAAATGGEPQKTNNFSLLPVLSALGVVIGLIFAIRAGLRRFLGGAVAAGQSSVVQVLTRVAIAPRSHVVLIRVGGRVLVVSDSTAGMRTLAQIDSPEEVADLLTSVSSSKSNSATAGFRQTLSGMDAAYEKPPLSREGGDENEFRIDSARDKVSGLLGKLRTLVGKGGDA